MRNRCGSLRAAFNVAALSKNTTNLCNERRGLSTILPLRGILAFRMGDVMESRPNFVNLAAVNRSATVVALLAIISVFLVATAHDAQAQTFSVLHSFTGGLDGETPYAGVTVGRSGILYGTATHGGGAGVGTVYKLTKVNSSWIFSPLYEFAGGNASLPLGAITVGSNGVLYGTTFGLGLNAFGTVFQLMPQATFCRSIVCYWNENVLHTFTGTPDGAGPQVENLVLDGSGNIFGTTQGGGMYNSGATFELTRSGGGYTASILHSFGNLTDGRAPTSGIVRDSAGNIYGTALLGGTGTLQQCHGTCGIVYQLVPSGGGWVENVLLNFDYSNGQHPYGNLIIDGSGSLYGTTVLGGPNGGGVVYKLAPSGGGFTYSLLYAFSSCGSQGGLAMDAAGNLFGVCSGGGAFQDGWIFELTNCDQACQLVDLHDFNGDDGMTPYGGPVLDASGNLYGTTAAGGTGCSGGCGVVWELAGVGAPREY